MFAIEAGAAAAELLKGPGEPSDVRGVDSARHLLAAFPHLLFLSFSF